MTHLLTAFAISAAAFFASAPAQAQNLKPCDGEEESFGYCDSITGKMVIAPRFMEAYPFRNGFAVVNTGKGYRAIDTTGKYVLKKDYGNVLTTNIPGLFIVEKDDLYGLIRAGDKVVIPLEYEIMFFELKDDQHSLLGPASLITLAKPGKKDQILSALARTDGKFLIPPSDTQFYVMDIRRNTHPPQTLEEARYVLITNDKPFLYNGNGKLLGEVPGYFGFWGGNLMCWDGQRVFFRQAQDMLEIKEPENAKDNLITVQINQKYGIINRKAEFMLPPVYDRVYWYSGTESSLDNIVVSKDDKWGVVDMRNNVIIPLVYEYVNKLYTTGIAAPLYYKAKKDGKYGLLDSKGVLMGSFRYDDISNFNWHDNSFEIKLGEKTGRLSLTGEETWKE